MSTDSLKSLWRYRDFIFGSVKREFQSKYRNSLFGAAWTVLNPLAMIIVYTIIFAEVMKSRLPGVENTFGFSIYLCSGLLTWGFLFEIVGRAQNVFIDNANLLKKITFPRLCLPVIIVISAMVNFSIVFSLFLSFLIISGNFPGVVFLAVVPLLILLVIFAIGLGVTLGVLNVFFRDVGQFFGIFLTFWFWLTPIVYPVQALAKPVRDILRWNPLVPLIEGFQGVFVTHTWPDWNSLWPIFVLSILFCLSGMFLFRRHAGEMVDEL